MNPRVSVIMPVYNGEKYLKEAIQSILDQAFSDFELIIVDDGSTDKTHEIIKLFSDTRIRYERRAHQGLISSLNFGISISMGEYIVRMDSDDRSLPNRLAEEVKLLDKNLHIAMCGSWATVIDLDNRKIGEHIYPPKESNNIRCYGLFHNPFIHPSVMIRKNILDKVGGYRSFWKYTEDYELWTRIIFKYETANIPMPLIEYRVHPNQVTSSKGIQMKIYGILLRTFSLWRGLVRV